MTTVDDNLVTAEPLIDQAIIDTVKGSKPDKAEIKSDDDDNTPVPEAPTHTEALAMCDHLMAHLETRSHSDHYFPYINSLHKFINNEQYNTKQQTLVTDFFQVIYLLYVTNCMLC